MVIVLNLNMTIDKTFFIPDFSKGNTYRADPVITRSGGKGVNVARALSTFFNGYTVCGFCCGYTGRLIIEYLKKEKLNSRIIYQKNGESRVCVSVIDRNGVSTDINEEGPFIEPNTIEKFIGVFKNLSKNASICVISGRTPRGIPTSFYSDIFMIAKKNGLRIFVDLTSPILEKCIEYGCETVKVNSSEFFDLSGLKNTEKNIFNFYLRNKRYGLKNLIITDGSRKIIAVCDGRVYSIMPVRFEKIVCPVGAGDSFMAGLVYSTLKNMSVADSLKMATAFSASDVMSEGAGSVNPYDVKKYLKKIEVQGG